MRVILLYVTDLHTCAETVRKKCFTINTHTETKGNRKEINKQTKTWQVRQGNVGIYYILLAYLVIIIPFIEFIGNFNICRRKKEVIYFC